MKITDFAMEICDELKETLTHVDEGEAEKFFNLLKEKRDGKRIFVYGAGRCGYVMRAFCMRLMHLGFETYFVPDTNTPAAECGDLFIAADGAGHLATVNAMAELAVKAGANIAVLTIDPASPLGRLADMVIKIPGRTTAHGGLGESIQPGGGRFEQSLFIFLDAIIAFLVKSYGLKKDSAFIRHSNLE